MVPFSERKNNRREYKKEKIFVPKEDTEVLQP
jgi:hypothetical protein